MPVLSITLNVEQNPWEDIGEKRGTPQLIEAMGETAAAIRIGGLPCGMKSGLTSVAIAITTADGVTLITETSLALFLMAARALAIAYPGEGQ